MVQETTKNWLRPVLFSPEKYSFADATLTTGQWPCVSHFWKVWVTFLYDVTSASCKWNWDKCGPLPAAINGSYGGTGSETESHRQRNICPRLFHDFSIESIQPCGHREESLFQLYWPCLYLYLYLYLFSLVRWFLHWVASSYQRRVSCN